MIPPKRKPGRPKGAKNKPKTLEQLIATSMEVVRPKPKEPKSPGRNKGRKFWTPEQAKERMAKARAGRTRNGLGIPEGWNTRDYLIHVDEAEKLARKIIAQMKADDLLPDDSMAQEALQAALVILRTPQAVKDKISIINTILNYTKQKPATKADVTVRTAEDFLDEIADSDGPGS